MNLRMYILARKSEEDTASRINKAIILSAFASLMILFTVLVPDSEILEPTSDCQTGATVYNIVSDWHSEVKDLSAKAAYEETEILSEFTEEVSEEMNCLMYATIPIGRYYITAYNDEETACKITASGGRVHQGTITTAAADVPKYFHFGDYIEVDGRLYRIEDTGSAVKKKHIDLFFDDYKAMARYGSNYQTIYRVEFPFGKPKFD